MSADTGAIMKLLEDAKSLAGRYRALTGKPLGITGEVAEFEAARLLNLELAAARTPGYDAIEPNSGRKLSIKGRCVLPGCKPGQRMGKIDTEKEFDAVLLVLMDETFNALSIWQAERDVVVAALRQPGSKARNERGALGITKFKSIGKCIWQRA